MYNDRFTYDEFLISLIHNDIHLNLRQTADLCHTEYSLAWCHWSNLARPECVFRAGTCTVWGRGTLYCWGAVCCTSSSTDQAIQYKTAVTSMDLLNKKQLFL